MDCGSVPRHLTTSASANAEIYKTAKQKNKTKMKTERVISAPLSPLRKRNRIPGKRFPCRVCFLNHATTTIMSHGAPPCEATRTKRGAARRGASISHTYASIGASCGFHAFTALSFKAMSWYVVWYFSPDFSSWNTRLKSMSFSKYVLTTAISFFEVICNSFFEG
jgi:hypothetical protein